MYIWDYRDHDNMCKTCESSRKTVGTKTHPKPRSSFQLIPAERGKSSFLHWNVNEYVSHTPWQTPRSDQNKVDSMGFFFLMLFLFSVVWVFLVFLLLFVCFDFCSVSYWKGERTRNWMNREGGKIWEELGRKRIQSKYILWKIAIKGRN